MWSSHAPMTSVDPTPLCEVQAGAETGSLLTDAIAAKGDQYVDARRLYLPLLPHEQRGRRYELPPLRRAGGRPPAGVQVGMAQAAAHPRHGTDQVQPVYL